MGAQPVAILDSISPAEARQIAHEALHLWLPDR